MGLLDERAEVILGDERGAVGLSARAISVVVFFLVAASMLLSEYALIYSVSFFLALTLFLVFFSVEASGSKLYVWWPGFVYFFFLVYVICYWLISQFIYKGALPRDVLTGMYLPVLMLLAFSIFKRDSGSFFVFILLMVSVLFYAAYNIVFRDGVFLSGEGRIRQTNWGNFIGSFLPFVFLINRRLLSFFVLLFFSVLIIFGLKRSGFIVVSFSWVLFFLLYVKGFAFRVSMIFLSALFIFFLVNYFDFGFVDFFSLLLSRMQNIADDGGSGRLHILMSGITYWVEEDYVSKIFGMGHAGFQRNVGTASSLHNDVAELVFSYGVLGFVFILVFYFRLFWVVVWSFLFNKSLFPVSLALAFTFLVYSGVSGVYFYPLFFCPLVVLYGYLEAQVFKCK